VQPRNLAPDEHQIEHDQIDRDALYVISRLRHAGHQAYLVGGGVRDLLMHRKPKDFDIATAARPEQIKRLFRRCLLIGRRFRLAHVRFGDNKVIEVSTFRAGPSESDQLIVSDNVWGSPEEDVLRRDFTINGLFYDPMEQQVIDYVGGCHDLKKGVLRTIGQPEVRFRQDPVRMVRALKFRARFGLDIEPETLQALTHNHREIVKSAPARVLEELLRMLESGAAAPFFRLMAEHGFLRLLLPELDHFLKGPNAGEVNRILEAVDTLVQAKRDLSRSTLMACLVWPLCAYELRRHYRETGIQPKLRDVDHLLRDLLERLLGKGFVHAPRRLLTDVEWIVQVQYRMSQPTHGQPRWITQPLFEDALRVLQVRAMVFPQLQKTLQKWKAHK
jgi:poly(A) polymerase